MTRVSFSALRASGGVLGVPVPPPGVVAVTQRTLGPACVFPLSSVCRVRCEVPVPGWWLGPWPDRRQNIISWATRSQRARRYTRLGLAW